MTIPDPKGYHVSGKLPEQVALSSAMADVESEPFLISFKHYNDKECEIQNLQQSPAKKALNQLRAIGALSNVRQFAGKNIQISSVENAGEYKKLFKTVPLEEDVDICEFNIGSAERIFFFTVRSVFYLVAIKNSHYEIGKGRRR